MKLKRTIAAVALALMSAAGAQAADIPAPIAITPPAPPPPPAPIAPAFDWSGPYVGAYGGFVFGAVGWYQAGVVIGYNMMRGNFLAGLETELGAAFGVAIAFEGYANGRLGFVLGSRFLLYAEAGAGALVPAGGFLWNAGGGVEVGITSGMSLFVEGNALFAGAATYVGTAVQAGLNWHVGR
jgi:opacity protein-like surface antigen